MEDDSLQTLYGLRYLASQMHEWDRYDEYDRRINRRLFGPFAVQPPAATPPHRGRGETIAPCERCGRLCSVTTGPESEPETVVCPFCDGFGVVDSPIEKEPPRGRGAGAPPRKETRR